MIAIAGLALVGHLLVSYTTAKAAVDLGHTYHGVLLASGRGRDLRLLILTLGALGAAVHAGSLLAALAVVAVLCAGIVSMRLRTSCGLADPVPTTWACKRLPSTSTAPWQTPWGRSRSSRPRCSGASSACRATKPRAATSRPRATISEPSSTSSRTGARA